MATNPSNFSMTLGTARMVLETINEGWAAAKVAEAKRIVAYWKARAASKTRR